MFINLLQVPLYLILYSAETSVNSSMLWIEEGDNCSICATITLLSIDSIPAEGVNVSYSLFPNTSTYGEGTTNREIWVNV